MKSVDLVVYLFTLCNSLGTVIYVTPYYFTSFELCREYARIISDHYNNAEIDIYKMSFSSLKPSMRVPSAYFNSSKFDKLYAMFQDK